MWISASWFICFYIFFFKQKTAYEMRISDWSSDVCSSDLALYTVEEQLNEACGPLQEAGRRTIEGEELGSLLQFAVFNAMEICAAKSEEVAYYVRLARSYSSPAVAAPKTTVKTAWD